MHKPETGESSNQTQKSGNLQSPFDTEMTGIPVLKIKKLKYMIHELNLATMTEGIKVEIQFGVSCFNHPKYQETQIFLIENTTSHASTHFLVHSLDCYIHDCSHCVKYETILNLFLKCCFSLTFNYNFLHVS